LKSIRQVSGAAQFHSTIPEWCRCRLGIDLSAALVCSMADTHVIFEAEQLPRGGWQIMCHCPGGKIDYVTGFLDELSIHNWLATKHRDH
jgi:hypothetical protein